MDWVGFELFMVSLCPTPEDRAMTNECGKIAPVGSNPDVVPSHRCNATIEIPSCKRGRERCVQLDAVFHERDGRAREALA